MNTQKGFAPILLILLGLMVIGGGAYFYTENNLIKNNTKNEIVPVAEDTSTAEDTKTKKDQPSTALITNDIYQNGNHPGTIKSVYTNNTGVTFIDVDFYQTFYGKQAFLELAKSLYYNEENKDRNWDSFKTKYSTYSELEKFVQTMNEEEFDNYYAQISWEDNNRPGSEPKILITGNFPNGMIYEKNESAKIRTFPLDKNVIISIDEGSGRYVIDQYKFMQEFKSYNLPGRYDFSITITNGIVKQFDSIYRP